MREVLQHSFLQVDCSGAQSAGWWQQRQAKRTLKDASARQHARNEGQQAVEWLDGLLEPVPIDADTPRDPECGAATVLSA